MWQHVQGRIIECRDSHLTDALIDIVAAAAVGAAAVAAVGAAAAVAVLLC